MSETGSHRGSALVAGIALIVLVATGLSAAEPEWNTQQPLTTDSLLVSDGSQLPLPDPPDIESAFLWEWLNLPTADRSLRLRLTRTNDAPLPHHFALLTIHQTDASVAAMIHRDEGEPSTADLWRVGLALDREPWRVILGEFRVDRGMGWTIATAPSWNSSTDLNAPLRGAASRISVNRSSEEGYGWAGVAVEGRSDDGRDAGPAVWAGWRGLDARNDDVGRPIPYASQGDHSSERRTIDWWHVGLAQPVTLPLNRGTLDLIGSANRFPSALSPETTSARFRGIDRTLLTAGVAYRGTGFSPHQVWLAEVTAQQPGGLGGGVSMSHDFENQRLTSAVWGATSAFNTLHARPYTGFGSDPAGRTGTSMALEHRLAVSSVAGLGAAVEHRLPPDGGSREMRYRVVNRLNVRPDDVTELDAVLRASRLSRLGESPSDDLSLRGLWRVRSDHTTRDLIVESAWDRNGWAGMIGGQVRVQGSWLELAVSLAGVMTTDHGALVSVVEPAPPGLFPVRRVGSDQLRAAARLDTHLPGNATLWLQAGQTHPLGEEPDSRSETRLALGLEWRS